MVYTYLFDLYRVLDERKKEVQGRVEGAFESPEIEQHLRGRLSILNDFETFLKCNYHAKWPRRMQKVER